MDMALHSPLLAGGSDTLIYSHDARAGASLSHTCCSAQLDLKVRWREQSVRALTYNPVPCEACLRSAEVMCYLMRGADIGYFAVLLHQLQQYVHRHQGLEGALQTLQAIPLNAENNRCILRPWQALQQIICERLIAAPDVVSVGFNADDVRTAI